MIFEGMKIIHKSRALQVHGILYLTLKAVNMWSVWLELIRCGPWISRVASVRDIVVVVEKVTRMLIQVLQLGLRNIVGIWSLDFETYSALEL